MNAQTQSPTDSTTTDSIGPVQPSASAPSAPVKGRGKAVKQGFANAHAQNEVEIARLTKEVQRLTSLVEAKGESEALPVSDADLESAIKKLENVNGANLAVLNLSLRSVLDFQPALTEAQKKAWKPRKTAMQNAHSNWTKENAGLVLATLRRASKMPHAQLASGISKNKQGKVTSAKLIARKMVAPKAKKGVGKGAAKPAQVAGNPSSPEALKVPTPNPTA